MLAHPAEIRLNGSNPLAATWYGYGTKMSPRNHAILVAESQQHVVSSTDPSGALDNGIEHRLHVSRRAADDAEHLSGCRLMLQGLAQFRVALLQFLEESDVLDGDDRLVRKGL